MDKNLSSYRELVEQVTMNALARSREINGSTEKTAGNSTSERAGNNIIEDYEEHVGIKNRSRCDVAPEGTAVRRSEFAVPTEDDGGRTVTAIADPNNDVNVE